MTVEPIDRLLIQIRGRPDDPELFERAWRETERLGQHQRLFRTLSQIPLAQILPLIELYIKQNYPPQEQLFERIHNIDITPQIVPIIDCVLGPYLQLSEDSTHHVWESTREAAYEQTYDKVWNFSEGRAPAIDEDGMFHIRTDGTSAYTQSTLRYNWVGAFKEARAVIEYQNEGGKGYGQFHILPTGEPAYDQKYIWVGAYNKGLAEVIDFARKQFIINTKGEKVDDA